MHEDLIASVILLSAASCAGADPRLILPPEHLVDRIERQVERRNCIGSLSRWERRYLYGAGAGEYQPPDWGIDQSEIHFSFHQAGVYEFTSGRKLQAYLDQDIDDRQYLSVSGEYNVANDQVTIFYCGHNHPITPAEREQLQRWMQTPPAH